MHYQNFSVLLHIYFLQFESEDADRLFAFLYREEKLRRRVEIVLPYIEIFQRINV